MEGVTILNTYVVDGTILSPWCWIALGCGIAAAVFLIAGLTLLHDTMALGPILAIIGLALGITMLILLLVCPREQITEMQVIVDNTVDMNDFLQHYKIVKVENLLYTVRPIL